MLKVLVGSAGTSTSFHIIKCLRNYFQSDIQIYLTDTNPRRLVASSIFCNKFYQVKKADSSRFRFKLEEILIKNSIDVYIPINNDEILNAINIKKKKKFKKICIWSSEFNEKYLFKKKVKKVFSKKKIRVPITYLKHHSNNNKKWIKKPNYGYGSKLIKIIDNNNQVDKELNDDFIIEEFLDLKRFKEITVDSLHDRKKNKTYSFCRERLEVKSGVCTKANIFYDKKINKLANKIANIINQNGLICFQIFKFKTQIYVTDLNLRPGGGTSMTCSTFGDIIIAGFLMKLSREYKHLINLNYLKKRFTITRQYEDFLTDFK